MPDRHEELTLTDTDLRRPVTSRVYVALFVVALVAVLAGTGTSRARPVAAAPTAAPLADGAGIHVVDATWVDSRKVDVTVSTPALSMPVHVLVIVPADYFTQPATRYPSVYLLNGCNAGHPYTGLEYMSWEAGLHVEATTTAVPAIFVMPEGGAGGFYTNWVHAGTMGQPQWETFHVDELVPWIDQNFRTIADRAHRGIMGISMGGFGSMSYPARHPDVFGVAASLSGAADTTTPPDLAEPASSIVVGACAISDGGDGNSTFGSHTDDELNWRAHDPAQLVENYSNTSLYLYTGNGEPGPLDPPGATTDGIEQLAHQSTLGFMAALEAVGGSATLDDYGPGTHTVPYWQRDFADALPRFMADFAAPHPVSTFTYKTTESTYDIYGLHVQLQRLADEFSVLHSTGQGGFTLSGSGSATVTTADGYQPGVAYDVTVTTQTGVRTSITIGADAQGRLTIVVPLGTPNPDQEFFAGAVTNVFTSTVAIVAVPTLPTSTTSPPSTTLPTTSTTTTSSPSTTALATSATPGGAPAQPIAREPTFTG